MLHTHTHTDLSIGAPTGTQPPSHSPEQKRSITGEVISDPGMVVGRVGLVGFLEFCHLITLHLGGDTTFWHDNWVGSQPLKEEWEFQWRQNLFVWEEELRDMLVNLLTPIQLSNANDEWRWHYSTGGMFSFSVLYQYLSGLILPPIYLNPDFVRDLSYLWKRLAPSKVIVFSWQLLLRQLPTTKNLAKRGIVDNGSDSNFVLCPMEVENDKHLFGWCAFASTIWHKVFNWFGWGVVVPRDPLDIFQN
ncbi:ribonuclease H protein, partial [Trifolium medium]|nr:ribonuclease H protein [Trifolium medium]